MEVLKNVGILNVTASPSQGETVSFLSGNIGQFATDYTKLKSEEYCNGTDQYAPTPIQLTWGKIDGALRYAVQLSEEEEFSNYKHYDTVENSLALEDLRMGTKYFYRIIAYFEGRAGVSAAFSFETAYMPRTFFVEGVSNTRDAGGYYTENKQYRIRQDMIYRGGRLDEVSEAGKQKLLQTYGVKTDLDLRGELKVSPLGEDVNLVCVSGPYYLNKTGINTSDEGYRSALITEIKTFAKACNYPIYVHCALGRDRTATICFLINALCGVGERDLFFDYETSFFSVMGNLDGQRPTQMVGNCFALLYNYIKEYGNGSLAENTAKYMLDLGITQTEIDQIRAILLEKVEK